MKKLSFIIALILVSMAATAGNKNEIESSVSVVSESANGVYKVNYKAAESGKVKISILNSNRTLIYTETLTLGAFVRPYNFNSIGEGDYIIVLEDKTGKVEEKISFKANKVSSFVKVSQIENNKYIFRAVSTGADQLDIRIIGQNNQVLHAQSVDVNGATAMIYNLEKSESNPVFVVTSSNGTVTTVVF